MAATDTATVVNSTVKTELIPDTIADGIGQVALDGFKRYKAYLREHPAEERAFQARVAEVRERYGLK